MEITPQLNDIAIVGMAARYPNSPDVAAFWRNIRDGVECIRFFSDEELLADGVPQRLLDDPNYVRAYGYLAGIDQFDARFFGFTPREAESMDPQHRVFLECAWEALENAGCVPDRFDGTIGIYAGAGQDTYYIRNVLTNPALEDALGYFQTYLGNDKDFITTRASYKLNLTGPSVNVQTACSTSLVAMHLACQNLLNGECDLALAGGVSIVVTGKEGYLYSDGGVNSPDGHCRPFAAQAQGMVGGDGVGLVVLRRLEDALAAGDTIHAVIKGTAVNNDGADKIGFTAPSVSGQAAVIAEALAVAGVQPETVGYVEAHGTATPLGDPIEVAALTKAFQVEGGKIGYCALGSVKSNIGHTNTAAGVAGVIKTVLALQNKVIPPTLHYQAPNPEIDFDRSPFVVSSDLRAWPAPANAPRRAGVSAFGIGGTNAHVVLEEAPEAPPSEPGRRYQLMTLSAKTAIALNTATGRLQSHLEQNAGLNRADAAYTLHLGRVEMTQRRAIVLHNEQPWADAAQASATATTAPPVIFMFPGQGAQHANMGRNLYETEARYREWIDRGAAFLKPQLGLDIRTLLYPPAGAEAEADDQLRQTAVTQPVLFVVGYAMAQVWLDWGVKPAGMIGHSVGEYVAACLAGVFSWQDALSLLVIRGRLIQALPAGSMLAVSIDEAALLPYLDETIDVAAVNSHDQVVVAGADAAVGALAARLTKAGIDSRPVATSHAFHSAAMDVILPDFAAAVAQVQLQPPTQPLISTATGAWLTAAEATDSTYWVRHVRRTVRFAAGLATIGASGAALLLDVGPGQTAAALARRHPATRVLAIVASARHPRQAMEDDAALQLALGRLWCAGVPVDWDAYHALEQRRRIPLPTYPFERQRHWSEPGRSLTATRLEKKPDGKDWIYVPSWQRTPHRPALPAPPDANWLIFAGENDVAPALVDHLQQAGQRVTIVRAGSVYQVEGNGYQIRPGVAEDYGAMVHTLIAGASLPDYVLHLWGTEPGSDGPFDRQDLTPALDRHFYSHFHLARALNAQKVNKPVTIVTITTGLHDVSGDEVIEPEKGVALGPTKVLPLEFENIRCLSLDVTASVLAAPETFIPALVAEVMAPVAHTEAVIAYRGRHRWTQTFVPTQPAAASPRWRDKGVYLITGGLGGVGLALAEQIAYSVNNPHLVLLGRSSLSPDDAKNGQITALTALGATVEVVAADVTDYEQMGGTWRQLQADHGRIDGVIHAAGLGGGGATLLRTPAQVAAVLAPKVQGTQVLARLMTDQPPDFFLLCSSLAATLGGFGQIDYCAANAFLEAFALFDARRGRPTMAVAWDIWNETGMATTELPENLRALRAVAARTGMSRAEGMGLLPHILGLQAPQLLISTVDWNRRYREQFNVLTTASTGDGPASRAENRAPDGPFGDGLSPVARQVTAVWQALFGLPKIRIDDDFFDLGGHSLLATQLLNRLRRDFPEASLSLSDLFDRPTIAGISALISQEEPADVPDMRALLATGAKEAHEKALVTYMDGFQSDLDWATLVETPAAVSELIWAFKRDMDFPLYPHEVQAQADRPALAAYVAAVLARQRDQNRPAHMPALVWSASTTAPVDVKNPSAIFLLSAPRSGSTLLRLMLAGHSGLLAPPELALLSFAGARSWLANQQALTARTGYEQALLALGMSEDDAAAWVTKAAAEDRPVQDLYRHLQTRAAPRTLVDKTPGYGLDLAILQRAESLFAAPRYIFLTRHPYAVIESFARQRMNAVLGQAAVNPFALAEVVWRQWNENILAFAAQVGPDRVLRLSYEMLVRSPESAMAEVAEFLGLPFEPALTQPYAGDRMLGGLGDPDILQHEKIDATLANSWQNVALPWPLLTETAVLARELGYELPEAAAIAPSAVIDPEPPTAGPPARIEPASFAQRRFWFLSQYEPDLPVYNLPTVYRLHGAVDTTALATSLQALVDRHEALRTTFETRAGEPVQRIAPQLTVPLTTIDLRSQSAGSVAAEIDALVKASFDLAAGPLLRASLLHLGPSEQVLVIVIHHIVTDGWSVGVFLRELFELYRAAIIKRPAALAPLPFQYADYSRRQRAQVDAGEWVAQLDYWRQQLGDAAYRLNLPTDFPRPQVETHAGERQYQQFAPKLSAQVLTLSKEARVTPFMTLLSAFAVLLHRYSEDDDLLIGTPIAGRRQADVEGMIGIFLNTLVLRAKFENNLTFRELLRQVRANALAAYENQDIPFEAIIDELNPTRDTSRSPIFQVMFGLQNMPDEPVRAPGLTGDQVEVYTQTTKLDLSLYMYEHDSGFRGTWEYNTALFSAATIERMQSHFALILAQMTADVDRPVGAFPLLTAAESSQIDAWNETEQPGVDAATIPAAFEAQVRRTPAAAALLGDETGTAITYEQLNARANQLARHLRQMGVQTGTYVGVALPRGPEMVTALLAVMKAGSAYLPLDPAYPTDRLAFMIADSGAQIVIADMTTAAVLPAEAVTLVQIDADWPAISTERATDLVPAVAPIAAYLMYTSGSTGRPKGVLGTHKGALNRFSWMWEQYPFGPGERSCQKTSLGFVDSTWEIFGPLLQGVPAVIIADEVQKDPRRLVRLLAAKRVTRIVLVPSLLSAILATHSNLSAQLPDLTFWVTSGETLSAKLAAAFQAQMPKARLINLYGSSEVAGDATCFDLGADGWTADTGGDVPIGRPIANTIVRILDPKQQPVAIGLPGEIYVGGANVALGYANRPALTASRFVPDPLQPGAILFRTGDRGAYRPDGHIRFLGRRDYQVKIRGFRVELGEIEAALQQAPAVAAAVVVTQMTEGDDKRLLAYVVLKAGADATTTTLRRLLEARLPAYMVPTGFVFLDRLPLTPSGKIDRLNLPEPGADRPELATAYTAPATAAESLVARIWHDLLKVEKVGRDDNFFELGGHSLLAVQLTFLLQARFRVELPLRDLFAAPTVAGIVAQLGEIWGDPEVVEEIALTWQELEQAETIDE